MIFKRHIFMALNIFMAFSILPYAHAKDLYVSPLGDDKISYGDNSINSPWKSLIHSIYNIKAGDILYIREGVYTPLYTLWTKSDYTSKSKGGHPFENMNAESGTEKFPVIITAYPSEVVIIDLKNIRTLIELDNKSYWTFKNLIIINTGKAFNIGEDMPTEHITFESMIIRAEVGGDNSGNISLQGNANNIIINNCILNGPGTSPEIHANTTALYITRTQQLIVSNNEIYNAPIGLYFKHANDPQGNPDIQIFNNYIHDTSRNAMQLNSNGALIVNNIFGVNNKSVLVNEANGVPGGDFNTFNHNTFLTDLILQEQTQSGDTLPGAIGNSLINNIFKGGKIWLHRYSDLPHNTLTNYNMYSSNPIFIENRIEYNLKDWQNITGNDANSIMGSPIFTEGNSPSWPGGFVILPNSPGVNSASDGENIGADARFVGSNLSKNTPNFPTDISIQ